MPQSLPGTQRNILLLSSGNLFSPRGLQRSEKLKWYFARSGGTAWPTVHVAAFVMKGLQQRYSVDDKRWCTFTEAVVTSKA